MGAMTGSAAAIVLAALMFMAPQVQPVPGPGSGVVTVTGRVEVANTPDVGANQRGDWKVAIANVPDVRVTNSPTVVFAPLPFVRAGGRYEISWPAGDKETVRVSQLSTGGWVRVESPKPRWVNLTSARSVDELP